MTKVNNYINHIAFVIDASGSMQTLKSAVIDVFDMQIKHLALKSQEMDQETRVTLYAFDNSIQCICYDKDVMRLPSLRELYKPAGGTALLEATNKAIDDLNKTAQLYGDHAFLLYVITDGEENASRPGNGDILKKNLKNLVSNWTVAVLVPDQRGFKYAESFGFSPNNIAVWDATSVEGMKAVGEKIKVVTETYMSNRAAGIRSTTSLFTIDTSGLASRTVSDTLTAADPTTYVLAHVPVTTDIKSFTTQQVGKYIVGNTYYELMKSEEIQSYKKIAVQNKISKKVWVGDEARQLLQLPNHTIKVKPEHNSKFTIFVQSTSVNRKLIANTTALIFK